jgi:protein-disulfide isomerase
MCLGLYITNFCLLAVAYWSTARGALLGGFLGGIQNIVEFGFRAFTGAPKALVGLLAIGLCALASAMSPQFVLKLASDLHMSKSADADKQTDWVSTWRASQVEEPRFSIDGGSFADYAKGNPAAPIQIVEFADMECPGCRDMYATLKTILKDFDGQYYLVFKNFPLDSGCNPQITQEFHLFACYAAYITRCAGEQGKFWESLDLMFSDPTLSGDGQPQEVKAALLQNAISTLGLDGQAMQECVDSTRYKAKLVSDVEEGMRLGLASTPSFWINGKILPVPSREGLLQVFDAILAEKGLVRAGNQDIAKANE